MSTKLGRTAIFLGLLAASTIAACSGDGDDSGGGSTLTVWSLENQTDRVQRTQAAADRFTAETGVKVKIVGTDENQFTQLITSAAAAGRMPDVVGALPLAQVWQLAANELLDTGAAADVVADLGEGTFTGRTLELTRDGSTQLAVPSDTYPLLLIYRKDLFDRAGLPVPDTFERIEQAARTLNAPQLAGITMSTGADEAFTAQTFEYLALANNCNLVDQGGTVTLDSQSCVDTFRFFGNLGRNWSVPGAQGVDSTRATYFAGRAAMMIWSSFILDEMAGLRNDAKPTCQQCAAEPTFLARNSGFVTAIKGPNGAEPAGYGELTSWVITNGSGNTDAAKRFVQYMMDQAYLDWLGIAPEGKFPARTGTASEAQRFTNGWNGLPAGVDAKRPLAEVYPADVIETLRTSPGGIRRWGFAERQGELVGATLGELAIPKVVNGVVTGGSDPAGAARQATDAVKAIQSTIK